MPAGKDLAYSQPNVPTIAIDDRIACMKDLVLDEVTRRISEAAAALRVSGAKEVYLFGSAAGRGFAESSDVDLAVSGLPPDLFFRAMSRAAKVLGRPLDLVDLDEDTPFTRYLRHEGELRRVG